MHLKSILNFVQPQQDFVYSAVTRRNHGNRTVLEIEIRPRKGRQPVCSKCGQRSPGYDTLQVRRFEFVPLWGLAVFFLYAMRRVRCSACGVMIFERGDHNTIMAVNGTAYFRAVEQFVARV